MSTRGPQRWCPDCRGQIYFHHHVTVGDVVDGIEMPASVDVWYCQGCAKLLAEDEALRSSTEVRNSREVKSGRTHR